MSVYVVPLKYVEWEIDFANGWGRGWSLSARSCGCYAMFRRVS